MGSVSSVSGTGVLGNSGLDVQTIVDNLMYVEQAPVRALQSQETTLQTKVTAFQSLNTKVSTLLDKANNILFNGDTVPYLTPYTFEDRLPNSIFAARKAASTDETILTATASKGTAAGNYAITVGDLAVAESGASSNFADTDTTKTGTGTLVFQIGSNSPVTVTIDTSNNTLAGVQKAINNTHAGVTASLVNDGSSSPYRLLITSNDTGIANKFTVTDHLAGGQPLGLQETTQAKDAQINVNGIDINKSSNSISDVIDGVTLNLKAKTSSPVYVSVSPDTDSIVSALNDLVNAYNDVNTFVNSQFTYNTTTKSAGVLSGDSTLRGIQANLQNVLSQSITNNYTSYSVISQIGLTFNNDGSLALNETKLRDALASDPTAVAALLLGDGIPSSLKQATTTDPRVTYQSMTSATQPGTYGIAITGLASQASVTGTVSLDQLAQDENLTITYGGGTPILVPLHTGDDLTAVLQEINNALTTAGVPVTAANDGSGKVKITSNNYGSSASTSISVISDQPAGVGTTGFGNTVPVTGNGLDIAGTINGHSAVGNGLTLTGAIGTPEEGLALLIAQTTTGDYGAATVTAPAQVGSSIAVDLQTALSNITDPLSGPIEHATDGLNQDIKSINDQIDAYNTRLAVTQQMLTDEFNQASEALQMLSVTQASLTSQLNTLSNLK